MPGLQREDILTKLMLAECTMKALLDNNAHLDGLPACKESAMVMTAMKVREFKESLTDYFVEDV